LNPNPISWKKRFVEFLECSLPLFPFKFITVNRSSRRGPGKCDHIEKNPLSELQTGGRDAWSVVASAASTASTSESHEKQG
jgi:hypothetical protein